MELELKSEQRKITVESSAEVLDTDQTVQQLGKDITAMHKTVPLSRLSMHKVVDEPLEYDYEIQALDGRLWRQTVRFSNEGITFTFDVSDRWKLEEFAMQRPIRDALNALVRNTGLEIFLCEYN